MRASSVLCSCRRRAARFGDRSARILLTAIIPATPLSLGWFGRCSPARPRNRPRPALDYGQSTARLTRPRRTGLSWTHSMGFPFFRRTPGFEPSPMDVLSRAFPLRRFSSSVWPAVGVGPRGPIPRERNPCLAERTAAPGWTLPLPAVPREGTARLHAAEEHSHRFQPTTGARVILACRRAVAHFLVSVAAAGAPVRSCWQRIGCSVLHFVL